MSRKLAAMLNKPEHLVAGTLAKLEEKAGFPSEDVRLIADNARLLRAKVAQLGLDPDDTTSEELYYALQARFARDVRLVDEALGVKEEADQRTKAQKSIELASHVATDSEVWALKSSTAKNLIKQQPPKKLMRILNYRSVDSLLKRRGLDEIFVGAGLVESPTWQKNLVNKIAHLDSVNFELRPAHFFVLDEKLGKTAGKKIALASSAIGAVGVCASSGTASPSVLTMALFLLDELNRISVKQKSGSLHSANPALRWWSGAEHLLHNEEGELVSFNFKDAALNLLNDHPYHKRLHEHASRALWAELLTRYRKYLDEIPESLDNINYSAGDEVGRLLAANKQLALEYSEA